MAPSASNTLEQSHLGEDKTSTSPALSTSTSLVSAPTTSTVPQYQYTTPCRSGMRTISASDFVDMGRLAAPPPNTPETNDDPFVASIRSPPSPRTRFNNQGRPLLTFPASQVKDLQAYLENSDSDNRSTLVNLFFSGLPSHVTTGGLKEEHGGDPKAGENEQVGDEGENKLAR